MARMGLALVHRAPLTDSLIALFNRWLWGAKGQLADGFRETPGQACMWQMSVLFYSLAAARAMFPVPCKGDWETAQLWLWRDRKQICSASALNSSVIWLATEGYMLTGWSGAFFFLRHCFVGLLRSTDCLWLSLGPCVCQSYLPANDPKASVIDWMVNAEAYQTYMIYPLTFRYCHLLAQWSSSPSCGYPSALAQGVSITCCFLFFLPFLFFCVYVCMHTCVNVCGVIRIHKYVWMYMGGEEDVRCLPQSFPILFFEMTFYWTWSPWCVLASKPHTCTVTSPRCWGYNWVLLYLALKVSSGDRNSGSHACMTSMLPTEPST